MPYGGGSYGLVQVQYPIAFPTRLSYIASTAQYHSTGFTSASSLSNITLANLLALAGCIPYDKFGTHDAYISHFYANRWFALGF